MRRYREKWGYYKARSQGHTVMSIRPFVNVIHERFPTQGVRKTKAVLRQEYGVIASHNRQFEPAAVARRRRHAYERHGYFTEAVGECWAFDQHDKWARFKLYLHVGLDVYTSRVLWCHVYRSNRNPRLICGFYLDAIEELGYMPCLTQSDRGSENHGIANAQTELRHLLEPELGRTLQHRWRGKNRNIKPEVFWSILRRGWAPGFENVLQMGLSAGFYDPTRAWERY
ncbi:hypothetical protein SISNIDRAFT_421048, partial [Sistotremastrum niveocremeum HHB9708]